MRSFLFIENVLICRLTFKCSFVDVFKEKTNATRCNNHDDLANMSCVEILLFSVVSSEEHL